MYKGDGCDGVKRLPAFEAWLGRRADRVVDFLDGKNWAAMTGSVSIESLVLFLMIFLWTPPHFWALALYRARDYERARVPMLPVVAGPDETRKQIVVYAALLAPLALAPAFLGFGGPLYVLTAIVLGGVLLALSLNVYRVREGRA